jgi:hypothetical protein
MPVKRFQDGTGLTKRKRVKIKISDPLSPGEIEAAKQLFAGRFDFEGAVETAEVASRRLLSNAGLPTDGTAAVEVQSRAWHANEIIRKLRTIRAVKARVAAGKGDEADALARLSLYLGHLIHEAKFKLAWESAAIQGTKSREGAAAGGKARSTKERDRKLASEYLRHLKVRSTSISESALKEKVGATAGLKPGTARKAIDRGLRLLGK